MNNSRKLILYVLGSTILILFGVTLAYFVPKIENGNIFSSSGKAAYSDSNEYITLVTKENFLAITNTYPMSEERSIKKIEPYYFRIKNNSETNSVYYQIILEVKSDSTINDNLIGNSLSGEFGTPIEATTLGYDRAYKIYEGELVASESESFQLRIWIKENGTVENVLNKTWSAKVVIKSTKKDESSKLKIISGDINTPGSELKLGSESFYLLLNDEGTIRMIGKYGLLIGNKQIWDRTSELTRSANVYKIEPIDLGDFNYGRQDKRTSASNDYNEELDENNIVSYYGFIDYSDEEHVSQQGMCSNQQSEEVPCYSRYECSLLQERINEYATFLSKDVNIALSGDVLSLEELNELGCTNTNCPSNLSWIFGREYFLKDSVNSNTVASITYNGDIIDVEYNHSNRVVPIIECNLRDL